MKITQNAHGYCYKKTGHIKGSGVYKSFSTDMQVLLSALLMHMANVLLLINNAIHVYTSQSSLELSQINGKSYQKEFWDTSPAIRVWRRGHDGGTETRTRTADYKWRISEDKWIHRLSLQLYQRLRTDIGE